MPCTQSSPGEMMVLDDKKKKKRISAKEIDMQIKRKLHKPNGQAKRALQG